MDRIKKQLGFTLFELLVAIALMNLIALSLYASMTIGLRAKKSTRRSIGPYQSLQAALEFIGRDFSCAVEPNGILAGQFEGYNHEEREEVDRDSISFYSSNYMPKEDEIASDIVKVEYVLEERRGWGDLVLVRKVTKNLLSPKVADSEDEVVCRRIRSFDIRYYDGDYWYDSWDSANHDDSLPIAAEVTIIVAHYDKMKNSDDYVQADSTVTLKRIFLLPEIAGNRQNIGGNMSGGIGR